MKRIFLALFALVLSGEFVWSVADQVVLMDDLVRKADELDHQLHSVQDLHSYALGFDVGRALKLENIKIIQEHFSVGVQDALEGGEPRIGNDQLRRILHEIHTLKQRKQRLEFQKRMDAIRLSADFQAESIRNLEEADAFLKHNATREGIVITQSGLQYRVLNRSEGVKPGPASIVTVHYAGWFLDGTEFDSTHNRGAPMTWDLTTTKLIPGMVEAVRLMPTGSKYEFFIPPSLAYRDEFKPGIPPNSLLRFEIELLYTR